MFHYLDLLDDRILVDEVVRRGGRSVGTPEPTATAPRAAHTCRSRGAVLAAAFRSSFTVERVRIPTEAWR